MKQLVIEDNEEQLILTAPSRNDSSYVVMKLKARDSFFVLLPEHLLQIRDWINERCRELQFQGYLPDQHLGD